MADLTLYGYWRSSAAFRVRIALNLKGLDYTYRPINIAPGKDEQFSNTFKARNPQMRVPVLETPDGMAGQSMAIVEWLEDVFPEPSLLPDDPWQRLKARAFANVIACDIHPLNNLSVLGQLRTQFGADGEAVGDWYRHWVETGFAALETQLIQTPPIGPFAFGDTPGIAEVCLIPQMWNARRFDVDLSPYPNLVALDRAAMALPAFQKAAPDSQPDAPPS